MRDAQGHQLRTLVTAPKRVQGRVSAIFFVGWLSCDSLEYPDGGTDGFGTIFWRLIETSGFATMRLDKPGVGESSGDCCKTDFQTELSGYRAAFDSLGKYPFVDLDHVFVVGLGNGGGISPLVAQGHPVRGYLVRAHAGAGTGARSLKLRWQQDARGNQLRPETIHGFLFAVPDSQNGAPRNH